MPERGGSIVLQALRGRIAELLDAADAAGEPMLAVRIAEVLDLADALLAKR